MYTIHLFAGAGGGILADLLLGHTPIAACEIEDYPRRVLLQRQLDGILPAFPIWDDITTLRSDNPECSDAFERWKAVRDYLCVCGGFPCQDISAAGKGAGINGERSGLWGEMARVVREVRPRHVFVENSPMLASRGLGRVLGDLAEMGYNASWCVLGADDVGAPHRRKRIWILAELRDTDKDSESDGAFDDEASELSCYAANTNKQHDDDGGHDTSGVRGERGEASNISGSEDVADPNGEPLRDQSEPERGSSNTPVVRSDGEKESVADASDPGTRSDHRGLRARSRGADRGERAIAEEELENPACHRREEIGSRESPASNASWWLTEPDVGRVAHGIPNRVHRLKALGNGQVPLVAATAWRILTSTQ